MPKRRRASFAPLRKRSRPSQPTRPSAIGGDPDAPSDAEWETLKPFGSFIVRDEGGEEHVFRCGDVAAILPPGGQPGKRLGLYQYWIAKICEVRARGDDADDVWTLVQWYWSGAEVGRVMKSFKADLCGQYERILSDHRDYVSTASYDGVVKVKNLSNSSLDQPYIGLEDFYTRYNFEYTARTIDPGFSSCTCSVPYDPDDTASCMHFCPRPSCRRFYHSACLASGAFYFIPPLTAAARGLAFLASSPDTDDPVDIEALAPASTLSVKRTRRDAASASRTFPDAHAHTLLAALPRALVRIAQQPIVRGAAWPAGGVSGNVKIVVEARRAVYEAVRGARGVQEGWEEMLGLGGDKEEVGKKLDRAIVKVEAESKLQMWVCPECRGPI